MGLNAQTAVPVFTAGQILTAQQQKEINTGIPVFATTTTRDAAFGGTGEKTLAEGQFAYIEATDTTQYYDGSAWQSIGGGTYTSYTPSFVNFTLGNGATSTSYAQVGKIVHYTGSVQLGSTSSLGVSPTISLPVTSSMAFAVNMGTGSLGDNSTGAYYPAFFYSITGTTIQLACQNAAGTFVVVDFVSNLQPYTWAVNDSFSWNIVYKAA